MAAHTLEAPDPVADGRTMAPTPVAGDVWIRDRSRNLSFAIIWGVISALWLAMGMLVPLLWGAESTWVDMTVWALLCSVMGVPASDAAQ